MSRLDPDEFTAESIPRLSSELFAQYEKRWDVQEKIEELRQDIDWLRSVCLRVEQGFGPRGMSHHILTDARCFSENVETVLGEMERICDYYQTTLELSLKNAEINIAEFASQNTRPLLLIADNLCCSLGADVKHLESENRSLKDQLKSERQFSMRADAEKAAQISFLEDSYIETYAQLCRLQWLDIWQSKAGEVYENYENAEVICAMFEKSWQSSGVILCASYSSILLDLLDQANAQYDWVLSEELADDTVEAIREKRNRIYTLLIQCASRFGVLIGEE